MILTHFIGLMPDETCDNSIEKKLAIYARCQLRNWLC